MNTPTGLAGIEVTSEIFGVSRDFAMAQARSEKWPCEWIANEPVFHLEEVSSAVFMESLPATVKSISQELVLLKREMKKTCAKLAAELKDRVDLLAEEMRAEAKQLESRLLKEIPDWATDKQDVINAKLAEILEKWKLTVEQGADFQHLQKFHNEFRTIYDSRLAGLAKSIEELHKRI